MTTRTWNRSAGAYFTAENWSPTGVPQPGDTAVIDAGGVKVQGGTLDRITFQLATSSTAAINFFGTTILPTTAVKASSTSGTILIAPVGVVQQQGFIDISGTGGTVIVGLIEDPTTGAIGTLINTGALNVVDSASVLSATGSTSEVVQNNGSFSAWNPSGNTTRLFQVDVNLTGTGYTMVNANARVDFRRAVGAGQTVQMLSSTAGASLTIDTPSSFSATVQGFTAGKSINLTNITVTAFDYVSTGTYSGTLRLFNGSTVVASIPLSGAAYSAAEFTVGTNAAAKTATITTSHAADTQRFSMSDVHLNLSTTDQGLPYTGPVAGLQYQFVWNSIDAVAISTTAANVFIHGGAGQDAIAAAGGNNVLDGGLGSNFLVGTTAASGGVDTFFLDGRLNGETWSTIVNFHAGDRATIFGFTASSTLPWTASDGAGGFEGVTLHSELNGAGTGVNASITFTGLTLADQQNHFSTATGTLADGTPYLIIAYDR